MLQNFVVLILAGLFVNASGQKSSFANTRFDLNPNLPFEDSLPEIAESKDESIKQVLKKPHKTAPKPPPPAPATVRAPISPPAPPVTQAPVITFPTMPTIAPFSFPTIPPPTPPPVLAPIADPAPPPATYIPSQGSRSIQLVPANQHRDRAELWFKDNFDFSSCVKNVDSVSEKFLQKFPHNLLKNNKEVVLAELLNSRLKECVKKQERNEWNIIDQQLASLSLPASEETECRSGLVQEQISCYNVQSYSCQFVQPRYNFRLVPTRIIVQEARLAEDGAEKCRKIAKQLKKQKILN